VLAVLALTYFLVARGCGYDNGAVLSYVAYFGLYVVLPGVVCLSAVNRQALSLETAIALGVPTGFALEISGFLALSAADARWLYPYMPLAWAVGGAVLIVRRREWPVRWWPSVSRAGVALALSLLVLVTVLSAASQMFAEAPLYQGLPTGGIAHDWVYLVSRAATIKNHWPLEDPSLAGEPLQYHYFMLVHTAAAASVTGVEVTLLFLRLVVVPLGAVLVVQAYALGRRLSLSHGGGVAAAFFTVMAGEISFSPQYMESTYLGLFVRWLYVSPTFFFGMVFFGALLLGVQEYTEAPRGTWRHYAWLTLLAAAGTGAKGTVLPTLLIALGGWIIWCWLKEGKMPRRMIAIAVCLSAAFGAVYFLTMAAWGTGEAVVAPLQTLKLAGFWQDYYPLWQRWLEQWLPHPLSSSLAALGCGILVFFGTAGLRALAVPYLIMPSWQRRKPMALWLGLVCLSSYSMGMLLHLNSNSQLYVLLLMRLPMAVLAAAFFVGAFRRLCGWWRRGWVQRPGARGEGAGRILRPDWRAIARKRFIAAATVGVFLSMLLTVQINLWFLCNGPGVAQWLHASTRVEDDMSLLQQGLLWVRTHTDPNAVLISNAFTAENLKKDRWGAIDHTRVGLHFYYSALAERRLWVEGPTYTLEPAEARRRMQVAAEIFYRNKRPVASLTSPSPCYLLLDRDLQDGARVALSGQQRVFANARIEVYRVPSANATLAALPGAIPAVVAALP
jgi:hypothetical protein